MTNATEFEVAMVRKKLNYKMICAELDMSYQTLYNKVHNISEFKVSELDKLYKILGLDTLAEQQRVFFNKKSE